MPRVIYKFKLKLRHGSGGLDPYSYNSNLRLRIKRRFIQTLGTFGFQPWRSGTFIQTQKLSRYVGITASSLLVLIALLTIHPIVFRNRDAEAVIGTANPSTSTINISTGESADLSITASSPDGTFAQSEDKDMATFTVTTDNFTGYTLNLSGNRTSLTNADASDSIDSISNAASASDFSSTDTDKTTLYNNKWGYQVNLCSSNCSTVKDSTPTATYTALNDGNFLPAPAIADPTNKQVSLNKTECANGADPEKCPNSVDTYGIRLGARIDYTKPTGTYTNTFVVTVVANPIAYSITYVDSVNEVTSGTMPSPNPQYDDEETATTIKLSPTIPKRTGYTFLGWCLGEINSTATACSASSTSPNTLPGKTFAAGADFGLDQTMDNTNIKLYALWKVDTYSVQVNFAGTGVSTVTFAASGQTTQTVSTSGSKVTLTYGIKYTVTMTPTSTSYELDSWSLNNSNYGTLSSTTTNPTYFTPNASSGSAVIAATGRARYIQDFTVTMCKEVASSNAITVRDRRDNQDYTVRYINGNCWMTRNLAIGCNGSGSTYGSGRTTRSITSTYSNVSTTWSTGNAGSLVSDADSNSLPRMQCSSTYGAWYNYPTATAMTVTGDSSVSPTTTYDICPKNWHMPTSSQTSGLSSYVDVFNPVIGGGYWGNKINVPDYGFWWTATAHSLKGNYYLQYNGSRLTTPGNAARDDGLYVRCIRSV